jgi:hypothetical protein
MSLNILFAVLVVSVVLGLFVPGVPFRQAKDACQVAFRLSGVLLALSLPLFAFASFEDGILLVACAEVVFMISSYLAQCAARWDKVAWGGYHYPSHSSFMDWEAFEAERNEWAREFYTG